MTIEAGVHVYKRRADNTFECVKDIALAHVEAPDDDYYDDNIYDIWGNTIGDSETHEVVFNTDLNNEKIDGETPIPFKSIEDFKKSLQENIDSANHRSNDRVWREADRCRKKIADYRRLQKSCNSDEEFAFDKWQEIVEDLQNRIFDLEEFFEKGGDSHTNKLNPMVKAAEKYLKEGYVVTAYLHEE